MKIVGEVMATQNLSIAFEVATKMQQKPQDAHIV